MSEKRPYFYANGMRIAMSQYDTTLQFMRLGVHTIGNRAEGQAFEGDVLEQADVVMSVAHAKSVAVLLLNSVLEYERQFGDVRLPEKETKILLSLPAALSKAGKSN